jgi:hypothetical protein
MAIDLKEKLLTLAEAARAVPGGPVHVTTIHRWRLKGVRGIRLETFLRGGVRFTSMAALETFFARSTAAADAREGGDVS